MIKCRLIKNLIGFSTALVLFAGIFQFPTATEAQTNYLWPISDSDNYGKFLTSAFAEYRSDRFHAGVDIKTIWRDGHKIVAVSEGHLYRMRISPFGYGRSIYLRLKDGRIAIYAHLRNFASKLQTIADNEQNRLNRYSIDMYFEPGEISVQRGEIIGITGRSATRLQHLHFELRDRNNFPINPLENGFQDDDDQIPRPTKISIRPMNIKSHVKGDWQPAILPLNNGRNGVYRLTEPVTVWGDIGIGIDSYDRNGEYLNNYSIYSMSLFTEGKEVFSVRYDRYNYNQNKLINLDRDYRLLRRDKGRFQKLYLEEGNDLPFYGRYQPGDGMLHFVDADQKNVPFEIVLKDYSGNTAKVIGEFSPSEYEPVVTFPKNEFRVQDAAIETSAVSIKPIIEFRIVEDYQDDYLRLAFYSRGDLVSLPEVLVERKDGENSRLEVRAGSKRSFITSVPFAEIENGQAAMIFTGESRTNRIESRFAPTIIRVPKGGISVELASNAGRLTFSNGDLYKNIWLRYNVKSPAANSGKHNVIGSVIDLEPKEVFLRSNVQLQINHLQTEPDPDKLGIYARDNDGDWHYLGKNRIATSNLLTVSLSSLESVALLKDTDPPVINRIAPADGAVISQKRPVITAWFDDEVSGIAGENEMGMYLDDTKLIAEWDPILKKIFYIPREDLNPGTHSVRFEVIDNMENRAEKTWSFTIQ